MKKTDPSVFSKAFQNTRILELKVNKKEDMKHNYFFLVFWHNSWNSQLHLIKCYCTLPLKIEEDSFS